MFVQRYRVLGIDPGLTRCGYAVIDAAGPRGGVAVALGVIRTPTSEALPGIELTKAQMLSCGF